MAWHIRNNKLFYYRTIRVDGRPTSVYCGTGAKARKAAREVAANAEEAAELRAWRLADLEMDRQVKELERLIRGELETNFHCDRKVDFKKLWPRIR